MLAILLPLVLAFIVFLIGEYTRRRRQAANEVARKLVHLLHGLVVIAWYLWAGPEVVIWFEIGFFGLMFVVKDITKRYPKLAWLHQVNRVSWGEFFYPLGILAALFLADSTWFFVAAVSQLSLADAAAAMVGQKWGRHNSYKVFGQTKSWAGSSAFFITAALVNISLALPTVTLSLSRVVWAVLLTPLLLTVTENLSGRGSDNLTLPLVAVILLNLSL